MAGYTRRLVKGVWNLSALSLVVLVLQNSLLAVMTRLSRKDVAPEDSYHSSTLVLNQEIVKMLVCLLLFWNEVPAQLTMPDADAAAVTPTAVEITFESSKKTDDDNNDDDRDSGDDKETRKQSDAERAGKATPFTNAASPVTQDNPTVVSAAQCGARLNSRSAVNKPTSPQLHRVSLRPPSKRHVVSYFEYLHRTIFTKDTVLLLVPAALFTFQNFLVFVSLTYLDAVSYQIWSQSKLLTAALFSVWMLNRHLTWGQWGTLVLLVVGVLVTQMGSRRAQTLAPALTASLSNANVTGIDLVALSATTSTTTMMSTTTTVPSAKSNSFTHGLSPSEQKLIGITSCLLSGISSSFAGVYFEKVVKTTAPSLAVRNIQLSLFGIPLSAFTMLALDVLPNANKMRTCGQEPRCYNIFAKCPAGGLTMLTTPTDSPAHCPVRPFYYWQHYDVLLTWGLVGIHALGGLLVALVVKYADNIVKGFATGISLVVSGVMSSLIWGTVPSTEFVIGSVIVTAATILFHKLEPKRAKQ